MRALTASRSVVRRLRGESADSGVTLIETMVALIVFGLMATAALAGLVQMISTSRGDRNRVQAANVADQQLEIIRNLPTALIPDGTSTMTSTVDNTVYTITQSTAYVQDAQTTSTCDNNSTNALAYKRITESVTWANMGAIPPVRVDSLRAVNISGLSTTTGQLSVKVVGGSLQAQSGIPVTLTNTGGYSATQTTGADGCVVFINVPVGTVTASAGSSGYVGVLGSTPATSSTTVAAQTLTRTTVSLDQAGTLVANTAAGAPSNLAFSLYNVNWAGNGVIAFPNCGTAPQCVTGSPRTITNLFPFAGGYSIWAGTCTDADPSQYPPATRPTAVPVPAGGTANATVATATVTVTSLTPTAFEVYADKPAANGCTETYDLGNVGLGKPLSVQLPYGSWIISRTNGVHALSAADPLAFTVKPSAPLATVVIS